MVVWTSLHQHLLDLTHLCCPAVNSIAGTGQAAQRGRLAAAWQRDLTAMMASFLGRSLPPPPPSGCCRREPERLGVTGRTCCSCSVCVSACTHSPSRAHPGGLPDLCCTGALVHGPGLADGRTMHAGRQALTLRCVRRKGSKSHAFHWSSDSSAPYTGFCS